MVLSRISGTVWTVPVSVTAEFIRFPPESNFTTRFTVNPVMVVDMTVGDAPVPPRLFVSSIEPSAPVVAADMLTTPAAETAMGAVPVIAPPPEDVTQVAQAIFPVAVVRTNGAEAVTAGVPEDVPQVTVGLPAVACATKVTVPLPLPGNCRPAVGTFRLEAAEKSQELPV